MERTVNYKSYHIQYYLEGKGELLVFLHGWPVNAALWQAQVDYFKPTNRVLTFDWLGFGGSDHPIDHQYTFTQQKEILDILLEEVLEKGETLTLIGHDIGGPPAILWAHENQARVRRLILLNTVLYPFSTTLDKMSHTLFRMPIYKDIVASQFGLKMVMQTISKHKSAKLGRRFKMILEKNRHIQKKVKLKTILEPLAKGKQEEFNYLTDYYQALEVERYLIMAKHDPLCYAHIKKLAADNPQVPHFLIEDCGHYIALEKPDQLNAALEAILETEKER